MRLAVMSFNIRTSTARDGVNDWVHRRHTVAQLILEAAPDIVGVQEADPNQMQFLEAALEGYLAVGRGREADGGGEYSAIFVQRRALSVSESGTFWLSDTPHVPGSKHWGNNCVRIATWATCKSPKGRDIIIVNTHLDHESHDARVKGARLISGFIDSMGMPSILMGDMNAEPAELPIRFLMGKDSVGGQTSRLTDSWTAANPGEPHPLTFHSFTGRGTHAIDYVMCTQDVGVKACSVVTDMPDGRAPSDHFPVLALLELP